MSEVKGVLDNFRFETFVDVHSNIFDEYLSSVIAKLSKENPEYCSIEERIEELYKEYPKVMGVWIRKSRAIYPSRSVRL